MGENLFTLINGCSESSKQNIKKFLQELCFSEGKQLQQASKLQQIFIKITRNFEISKLRQISKDQRCKKQLTHYQFNYGQMTFKTIANIIQKVRRYKELKDQQIFYDLGSGSGKVLFAASLCYPFFKCIGIQFLEELYKISIQLISKIQGQQQEIQNQVNQIVQTGYSVPIMQIYNQNFQQYDWSNGTVIFVSSTCYTTEVMQKITHLSQKLKEGTILITLTRPIQSKQKQWRILQKFQGQSSWGKSTVYIHIKQNT